MLPCNEEAEIITITDPSLPGFGSVTEAFSNWEDVWDGPKNAMWTYLDVDEIETAGLKAVPRPIPKPVPAEWLERSERSELFETSGTLVLWSNFDDHRLQWRGAKATLENTETLIGRMYRKFIDAGDLTIRLAAYHGDEATFDAPTRVNDPLYITPQSSTPSPYDKEPMFQTWGEGDQEFSIEIDGSIHLVTVRISWAKEDTVTRGSSADRGSTAYGKHAARNVGVSVVRERRELELDKAWTIGYDPRERWWGTSVPKVDGFMGSLFWRRRAIAKQRACLRQIGPRCA